MKLWKKLGKEEEKVLKILGTINEIERALRGKKYRPQRISEFKSQIKELVKEDCSFVEFGYFRYEKKNYPKRGLTILITPRFRFFISRNVLKWILKEKKGKNK